MAGPPRRHDPYASLRIADFRWFIVSLLTMNVATQLQAVVVAWQIYALTHDPLSLGLIGLAEALPFIGFALPAGHVADRIRRLRIARLALAALLGIDPSLITVAEVEAVEWNDSCLGIVRIDAICAQGIVPGYRLSLAVEGRQFEYHTNADGSAFALAPATIEAEVEPAVAAVVKALAQALGLPEYRVNVVSVEAVEWPDSCLGIALPRWRDVRH